jgi:hypothetical protein
VLSEILVIVMESAMLGLPRVPLCTPCGHCSRQEPLCFQLKHVVAGTGVFIYSEFNQKNQIVFANDLDQLFELQWSSAFGSLTIIKPL